MVAVCLDGLCSPSCKYEAVIECGGIDNGKGSCKDTGKGIDGGMDGVKECPLLCDDGTG